MRGRSWNGYDRNNISVEASDDLDALSRHSLQSFRLALENVHFFAVDQGKLFSTVDAESGAVGGGLAHDGGMFRTAVRIRDHAFVSLRVDI